MISVSGQLFSTIFSVTDDEKQKEKNDDGQEIMERHYNALKKEMDKNNPNYKLVNCYLNKEFPFKM